MVKPKDGSPRTKYSQGQNEIKPSAKGINGNSAGLSGGSQLLRGRSRLWLLKRNGGGGGGEKSE